MAQKPLPRRPALLKRYSESSLLHPSTLPRHVDHEEIVKLLGDIPSRQRLFNTSTIEGTEAPNRYNRRFSELDYENVPPVHSVMSQSAEDITRSDYRRHFSDNVQVDYLQSHRSEPHGHAHTRHGPPAVVSELPRRVPRRATTYHGVPKTHSKRFVRIRETRAKEGATDDKDNSDSKDTTVHIPGEDEAVPYPSKETQEKKKEDKPESDKKETAEDVRQEQSRGSTAIKSGNGSIRRYRRSHRRKQRVLGDLPLHHERPEDEAQVTNLSKSGRKLSQLSSMASDEDVENLDQYAINQMFSHRYDDLAGVRRPSRTLHILRSPTTPTRSMSASIRRSHKPHQGNLESDQQEYDLLNAPEDVVETSDIKMYEIEDNDESEDEVAPQSEAEEEEPLLRDATTGAEDDGDRGVEEKAAILADVRSDEEVEVKGKHANLEISSEEDSDDFSPPSKFAALADADGRARYSREKNKKMSDAELTDEQVEEKVMKKGVEEERKFEKETCLLLGNTDNQKGTSANGKTSSEAASTSAGPQTSDEAGSGKEEQPRNRSSTGSETSQPSTLPEKRRLRTEAVPSLSASLIGLADLTLALSQKAKYDKKADVGGNEPKSNLMFGGDVDPPAEDSEKSQNTPQQKRKVTYGGDVDPPAEDSQKSQSTPRQRRKGVTWDDTIDHAEMCQMMKEVGRIGNRPSSGPFQDGQNKTALAGALQTKPDRKPNVHRQQKSRKKSYANVPGGLEVQSQLFVQLNELDRDDLGGTQNVVLSKGASWKSRARWIKFEENWEEGADRWSKPHVASLTFNSLPQLRRGLENGLIMLDVMETSLPSIFNLLVDGLVRMELIEPEHQGVILRMLHLNGTGNKKPREHWRGLQGSVAAVRRLSAITDLARHNSTDNNLPPNSPGSKSLPAYTTETNCSNNAIYSSDEVHVSMLENHDGISQNNNNAPTQQTVPREGIMRKLPEDAEGAMVMVAMEDSLNGPVAALIRLMNPPVFDNFLEAAIPLRFIFFLVGPDYSNVDYHEVGRAMSTLFSDDIFRDMAYAAIDKQDLLNGINEFLNDTMVLPPGDWDRDLLLPITRHQKREQEKVMQRRKTISPLQMEKDAETILKMSQDALNYADPLQRTGRIFGGLVNDVKRRFPHYKSDFTDGINFQCLAAFVFIYFACLSPAITFGGLLGEKTDNWMGVSEMIVSTSLCGMLFALLSGQPLVMLGGTGPVLIFEEYLYKFCKEIEIDFMAFRTWIGFWICVLATVVVMFEGSVLVRYFTRFTEEIFSTLISFIFIYETYKGLKYIVCANPLLPSYCFDEVHVTVIENVLNGSEWTSSTTESAVYADFNSPKTEEAYGADDSMHKDPYHCKYGNSTQEDYMHKGDDKGCSPSGKIPQPNTALFAIILTFGTFFISFFLRIFRSSRFLGRTARRALGNFGIAIAILAMVTLAYLVGHIYTDTIKITDGFHPTDPCKRGWLINPMGQKKRLPLGAVFGAIVPAFLVFILLYMETLLIGMVVNKECNKLRKGSGYHLDLFLIGVLSALSGLIGVPWMCATPIRTVSHIGSLSVLTRTHAPGVKPKLDHIKDQRVTNFAVSFLIGLSNLLAPLLREVPIAVLLGVFLYLGVTSLSGLQFIERLKIFFMPRKHHPDVRYIRMVKVWKMHLFTIIQVVCVMVLWVIKNSIIAMAFPFFLILLIFIRRLLKYFFSQQELEALDSEEEDEDDDRQVYDYDLG